MITAQQIAAILFCVGSAVVVGFHLAMIGGAPWGHLTMSGRWPGTLPPPVRLLYAISALLMIGMSFAVLSLSGMTGWQPPGWLRHVLMAYMALAILMHVVTPSVAERRMWLPMIVALTVALGFSAYF